jgi:hypothetical protein
LYQWSRSEAETERRATGKKGRKKRVIYMKTSCKASMLIKTNGIKRFFGISDSINYPINHYINYPINYTINHPINYPIKYPLSIN